MLPLSRFHTAAVSGVALAVTLALTPTAFAQSKSGSKSALRGDLPHRGGYNRAAAPKNETVMAQVGQVLQETAIRKSPKSAAPALFSAPKGTNVAVLADSGQYWGVLMANRTIAWIKKSDIELLDYNVEMASPVESPEMGEDTPPPMDGGDSGRTDVSRFTADVSGAVRSLIQEAYTYLGTPYVWGGTRRSGLDCSGLVMNVFSTLGVQLPRVSSAQAEVGRAISFNELRAGDRLYFDCNPDRDGVDHTGICLGNGYLIHASGGRHRVAVEKLDTAYWRGHFVVGRRDFE